MCVTYKLKWIYLGAPTWVLIFLHLQRARILTLDFLQFYLIKLIYINQNVLVSFSSICAWNMSSYGHILVQKCEICVPKISNIGCFGPKPNLKTPNERKFLDQTGCWVKKIKGEKQVDILRCGAAMVIKIVKNTFKISLIRHHAE